MDDDITSICDKYSSPRTPRESPPELTATGWQSEEVGWTWWSGSGPLPFDVSEAMKFLLDVMSSTAMLEPLDEGAFSTRVPGDGEVACFSSVGPCRTSLTKHAVLQRSHRPACCSHAHASRTRLLVCLPRFHPIADMALTRHGIRFF